MTDKFTNEEENVPLTLTNGCNRIANIRLLKFLPDANHACATAAALRVYDSDKTAVSGRQIAGSGISSPQFPLCSPEVVLHDIERHTAQIYVTLTREIRIFYVKNAGFELIGHLPYGCREFLLAAEHQGQTISE